MKNQKIHLSKLIYFKYFINFEFLKIRNFRFFNSNDEKSHLAEGFAYAIETFKELDKRRNKYSITSRKKIS